MTGKVGPRDVINASNGILVPDGDEAGLVAALRKLMSNDALRAQLAQAAPAVVAAFSREKVLAAWEDLFRELTGYSR